MWRYHLKLSFGVIQTLDFTNLKSPECELNSKVAEEMVYIKVHLFSLFL